MIFRLIIDLSKMLQREIFTAHVALSTTNDLPV